MSFLSDLKLSDLNPVTAAIGAVGDVVGQFVTTPRESAEAEVLLREVKIKEAITEDRPFAGQREINLAEAKHKSVFVAGWRPFIGWVCGLSLMWQFLGANMVLWAAELAGLEFTPPPLMGTEQLLVLTTSLLGIGGMRTIEKWRGIARSNMGHP